VVSKRVDARGRTKRPETRREELIDAALHLLTHTQLDDLRVTDVTEAAGAAKGTFYLYFPAKDDLLTALREEFAERFLRHLDQAVTRAANAGWNARIRALIESAVDYSLRNQRAHEVLFHAEGSTRERRHHDITAELAIVRWLAALFEAGAREGAFAVDDAEMVALLLYSAFHGGLDRAVHGGIYDRDRLIDGLEGLFQRTLAPTPAPRRKRQPT
jgi:AcrR family transcriptional regulator